MSFNGFIAGSGKKKNPVPKTGDYLYSSYLPIWKERFTSQEYWTPNQYNDGLKTYGSQLTTRKNTFMSVKPGPWPGPVGNKTQKLYNPGLADYNGFTPIPCWTNDVDYWFLETYGNESFKSDVQSAAIWALINDDDSVLTAVKDMLLAHVNTPRLDFGNRSIWQPAGKSGIPGSLYSVYLSNGRAQTNPFFFLGEYLVEMCRLYDSVKAICSASEISSIETWLTNYAEFLYLNLETDWFPVLFNSQNDRDNLIMTSSYQRSLNTGELSWATEKTHDGGYYIPRGSLLYHNRALSQAYGVGVAGAILNNTKYMEYGKRIMKEWLAFAVFPDGTSCEYHRGANGGAHYTAILLIQFCEVAEALFKLRGDSELWDFETSKGTTLTTSGSIGIPATPTAGGTKSIRTAIEMWSRQYMTTAGGNPNRTLDGRAINGELNNKFAGNRLEVVFTHMHAVALAYDHYKSQDLYDFMFFRGNKWRINYTRNLPVNAVRSKGPWRGLFEMIPDVPFLYFPDHPNTT